MNKDHIVSEIRRTAKENKDKALGMERFAEMTGIQRSDWYGKYWARWGDALQEAGFSPNEFKGAYLDDFVIEKMISLIRELARYPVSAEIKIKARQDSSFPSHTVFNRVGNKSELAQKVLSYCRSREGYSDVIEICQPIAVKKEIAQSTEESRLEFGFVYLMKSGRFYKIGRTGVLGAREYQLGIQLPDKLTTVHAIKTDDPPGIEGYWHRRFSEKRKNGEWFDLTTEDIKAFRRRKFM